MAREELLDVYDREVRASFPHRLPAGWVGEQDGPLTRCLTPQGRGFCMLTADASGLTAAQLRGLVLRTFGFYDEHGRGFEWKTPLAGTRVAGLWGGSTVAAYRGRGIYRALVSRRALLALERGYSTLQVDASEDSRPILERLGLHIVGRTVPYVTACGRLQGVTPSGGTAVARFRPGEGGCRTRS